LEEPNKTRRDEFTKRNPNPVVRQDFENNLRNIACVLSVRPEFRFPNFAEGPRVPDIIVK